MIVKLPQQRLFGLCLAVLFALLFLLCYGGTSLMSAWIPWRIHIALPFEATIPLLPAWSIIYLSMPLLLFYCIVKLDWIAQWALFSLLLVELLFACLCFLLFPVQMAYPLHTVSGFWQPLFTFATTLSMENNHLPSLHVAFACTGGLALQRVLPHPQAIIIWGWVLLVAISTLMIHEHHLLDVVAGVLLAVSVKKMVWHRAVNPAVLQRVRLEWLWWYNQWLFTQRHLRYGVIALMIAVQRLLNPARGNLLVSGYCFLQTVDDLMDGDRTSSQSPLKISQVLITVWQQGQFNGDDDLMCLAEDFYRRLKLRPDGGTAVAEVSALLQVMQRDYLRTTRLEVWTADTIQQQHQKTFSLSLNLLLFALSSQVRAKAIPELVMLLGWCSTMRDLREDLQKGIINIPAEVLPAPLPSLSYPDAIDNLLTEPKVIKWIEQQHQQALNLLNDLDNRMPDAQLDRIGKRIVQIFSRSIQRFAKQYFGKQLLLK